MECEKCSFYLCRTCEKKGVTKGLFSLGSIDQSMAGAFINEPAWIDYKARRYMAAAGSPKDGLDADLWRVKVAPRVFFDIGLELPERSELHEMHSRFKKEERDGKLCSCLHVEEFSRLLREILTLQLSVVSL